MADSGFAKPTFKELRERVAGDAESHGLAGVRIRLAKAWVYVRTGVGIAWGLYRYLDNIANQMFDETATGPWLKRRAAWFNVFPRDAEPATGGVVFTGTPGTLIPATTTEMTREDGAVYVVDVPGFEVPGGGSVTVAVTALVAGSDGNCESGTTLTLTSPIVGLTSEGVVDGDGLTGGTNQDDIEQIRARLQQRKRNPPQGGSDNDYIAWAQEVSNVGAVWVERSGMGAGTVVIRFVLAKDGDAEAVDLAMIPDTEKCEEVFDHIETKRPTPAHIYVVPPIPEAITFEIALDPDTPTIRAAVLAELRAVVREGRGPNLYIENEELRGAIRLASTGFTLNDVNGGGASVGIQQGPQGVAYIADDGITWA